MEYVPTPELVFALVDIDGSTFALVSPFTKPVYPKVNDGFASPYILVFEAAVTVNVAAFTVILTVFKH